MIFIVILTCVVHLLVFSKKSFLPMKTIVQIAASEIITFVVFDAVIGNEIQNGGMPKPITGGWCLSDTSVTGGGGGGG